MLGSWRYVVVLGALSVTACVGRVRLDDLDCSREASSYTNREKNEGFFIAAEIIGPERTRHVEGLFGRDLHAYEILPILIALENQGEQECVVEHDDVRFVLEDGTTFEPMTLREAFAATRYSRWRSLWGLPFILPTIFILRDVNAANRVMEKAYEEKGFVDYNMAPGAEPICKILFFRSPKDLEDVKLTDSTLTVIFRRRGEGPTSGRMTAQVVF